MTSPCCAWARSTASLEKGGADLLAAVEVGHLHDAQACERLGQVAHGNRMVIDLEPGRLDVPCVRDVGPLLADPVGQAALAGGFRPAAFRAGGVRAVRSQLDDLA